MLHASRCLVYISENIHPSTIQQPWLQAFLSDPACSLATTADLTIVAAKVEAIPDILVKPVVERNFIIPEDQTVFMDEPIRKCSDFGPAATPRTPMRLLALVHASSPDKPMMALWRQMAQCPAVQVYMLHADTALDCEIRVDETAHAIWCKSDEDSLYLALRHLSRRPDWCSWSAVLSTDVSSVFHWGRTLEWLSQVACPLTLRVHPQFIGGVFECLQSTRPFVSVTGACFFSPEIAQKLGAAQGAARGAAREAALPCVALDDALLTTLAQTEDPRLVGVIGRRQDAFAPMPALFAPDMFHARCDTHRAQLLVDALYATPRWTHVAVACNTVPKYARCLPWCVRAWLRLGIVPVVGLIGFSDDLTRAFDLPHECIVIHVAVPEGATDLYTAFLAQNARPYLAAWAAPVDAVTLLTDADMMPIRGQYFHGRAVPATSSTVSILRWTSPARCQVAMCYVGTHTASWRVLYPEKDFVAALHAVWEKEIGLTYAVPQTGQPFPHWFYDQKTLTTRLRLHAAAGSIQLQSFTDEELGYRRLCRASLRHDRRMDAAPMCTDYHMIRDGDIDGPAALVLAHVQ